MQAEVFHPSQLSARDADTWRAMCAAAPAFRSPLLSPEFARLVGEVRDDARVAVFRRGAHTLGFLAHHRRPDGFARPIAAAFSDYHALISAPGVRFDVAAALTAADIAALQFSALVDPHGLFARGSREACAGYVIEPGGDYLETLKAANPKRFKNWRRLQNKLEREVGELTLTPGDTSAEAFELLLAWKRDQYRRTGAHDVCRADWCRALLQKVFERREGPLQGVMTTLRAGGRLVAGHFGPAQGGVWHGWISSIDPEHAARGPGIVLMLKTPEIAEVLGLEAYDMAPSHDHYKAPFATRQVAVREGLALADSSAGQRVGRMHSVWGLGGEAAAPALGRLRRRLDQIASVELSAAGRVLGVVEALAGFGRRNAHRRLAEQAAGREAA
jgi:CelD/BcsL family acetyltransferase involved in cellulose biosynthesis